MTVVGSSVNESRAGGTTFNVAVRVTLLREAEIITEAVAATGVVSTVKVIEFSPAGTMMVAGTLATAGLLLERLTTRSTGSAGPFRVTVPVEGVPPVTVTSRFSPLTPCCRS